MSVETTCHICGETATFSTTDALIAYLQRHDEWCQPVETAPEEGS